MGKLKKESSNGGVRITRGPAGEEKNSKSLAKQIINGAGTTFLGRIIGKAVKFIFQIVIARLLGANAYGLYSLGFTTLGISNRFSQLGLQHGVVRFGSMYRGEDDKGHLKGTILVGMAGSLFCSILVGSTIFYFSELVSVRILEDKSMILVLKMFSIALPFYTLMTAAGYSARVFRNMKYDVGVRIVLHPVLLLTLTAGGFLLGYKIEGVLVAFILSTLLSCIIGLILLNRLFPELTSGLKARYEIKKILLYSLTVLMSGMSLVLIMKTDRVMLGAMKKSSDVGIYNAAALLASQATIFLYSFNAIFSPIISDLHNKNSRATLNRLFKVSSKWIFTMTLPVFICFLVFSEPLMKIFGRAFGDAKYVLIILGLSQLLNSSVGSSGLMLSMTGHEKIILANNTTVAILNVILNILLIPYIGVTGAAVATGTSIAVVNIAKLAEVYIIHDAHPYKLSHLKPVLAGIVVASAAFLLKGMVVFDGAMLFVGIITLVVAYGAIMVLVGLEDEDYMLMNQLRAATGY